MSGPIATCRPCTPANSSRLLSRIWRLVGLACRFALGAFFLTTGVSKITDLQEFRDYLAVQVGLGPSAALVVGALLPWLEAVCGLCLISGQAVREAAVLIALLLLLFIAFTLLHRIESDCGCVAWPTRFTPPPGRLWLLGRNLLLLTFALRTMLRTD